MIQKPLCGIKPALAIGSHSGVLPGRVRAEILLFRQCAGALKNSLSTFDITPDRLPLAVLLRVCPALKNPILTGPPFHFFIQVSGPLNAPGFSGLGLPDGLPPFQVSRAELENVRNP